MRLFSLLLIPLLLISIIGCFGPSGEVNITEPPSFSDATRIVVTPFIAEEEHGQQLVDRITTNLATRLDLILKDKEWVYDISDKVQPVQDKLQELGLSINDVYADPALASRIGQALKADLIITGMVVKPKLDRKDSNEHLMRQGRQSGISGTSTYITTRQSAFGRVRIKIIDTSTGNLLYNNQIRSYLKYWYAYQTQSSGQIIFKEDVEMLADLGLELPKRIAFMLNPSQLREEPEDKVLLKPDIVLKGNAGIIQFK